MSPSALPSTWFVHLFDAAANIGPQQLIGLRGLAPEFYTGLLHSAAAAESLAATAKTENLCPSGANSAEWSLLLLAPDDSQQIDKLAVPAEENFLPLLNEAFAAARQSKPPVCAQTGTALPFASGWQLYLSYELAAEVEPVLEPVLIAEKGSVIAQARRVKGALLFNHQTGKTWCCLENTSADCFARIQSDLAAVVPNTPSVNLSDIEEDDPARFTDAVAATLAYIRDGDVFQTNLSRQWRLQLGSEVASQAIYSQLVAKNPAPFSAWLSVASSDRSEVQDQCFELISSSPERLVSVEADSEAGAWINTRPIAGTRPRDLVAEQDQEYLSELQQSPKENAEHLMLIDLERNDLGRVCRPGSIEVNELMTIESFAHVHHIVSNVRGRKRADVNIGQVIAAVFPGGTITGCPKVRCMEIIAELEQCQRGAYTGAVGYLGLDGQLDLNIVIRSLVRDNKTPETLTLRAGAGIVADSNPEHELAETRAKANSVLRAFSA